MKQTRSRRLLRALIPATVLMASLGFSGAVAQADGITINWAPAPPPAGPHATTTQDIDRATANGFGTR